MPAKDLPKVELPVIAGIERLQSITLIISATATVTIQR